MNALAPTAVYLDRIARARASMEGAGVDVLLVSVGSDLPYLTGYEAMPLERLTMLVVPRDGEATTLAVTVRNAGTGRVDDVRLRTEPPARWQAAFERPDAAEQAGYDAPSGPAG